MFSAFVFPVHRVYWPKNGPVPGRPVNGYHVENATHIAVTGNVFAGLDGPAVKATGKCEKVVIVGNVITDIHRRSPKDVPKEAFDISGESQAMIESNVAD